MKKLTPQQLKRITKKNIKELLKQIEDNAIGKIDKAINCGALNEESEFLQDNSLLARAILESELSNIKIQYPSYQKENKNLQMFI